MTTAAEQTSAEILDIKDAVRDRDFRRCVDCSRDRFQNRDKHGRPRNLDVHRLVPGSAYSEEGCVTLCRKCHKKRHGKCSRLPEGPESGWSQIKVDSELIPFAKAAAALAGKDLQDWITDTVNEAASGVLGMPPIRRRATPAQMKEHEEK